MTQLFNRQEAEQAATKFQVDFPECEVLHILDIKNATSGEYERSFFSTKFGGHPVMIDFSSQEELDEFLALCQYIAGAIADNRQSEEYDSFEKRVDRRFEENEKARQELGF